MSRSGNDNLISRIAVKGFRQIACIGSDIGGEIQKSHAWVGEGCMEPLIGWQGQPKATSLDQFCDFPARDCADPDMARLVLGDERPCLRRKSIILMDPPYPDVCIEDDHRAASQVLSSTLSNGRSYSTFNPLSGYRDMPPAAGVAIGLIVTSTRCPGSYGNWSRVTEPCAPTVVSMWTCLSG